MAHPVFPVALRLHGRPVLLVGGDAEAVDKVPKLRDAGARIAVVATAVHPSIAACARRRELVWYARELCSSDLFGQAAVILTYRDRDLCQRLMQVRRSHGFLLCAVDQPESCDFFLMSTVRRGPVQIAITTGGAAPLLARHVREALEVGLDGQFSEFARKFASLRERLSQLPRAERLAQLQASLKGFAMEVGLRYPETLGASERAK